MNKVINFPAWYPRATYPETRFQPSRGEFLSKTHVVFTHLGKDEQLKWRVSFIVNIFLIETKPLN